MYVCLISLPEGVNNYQSMNFGKIIIQVEILFSAFKIQYHLSVLLSVGWRPIEMHSHFVLVTILSASCLKSQLCSAG